MAEKKDKYYYAVGKRKTAVAQVKLFVKKEVEKAEEDDAKAKKPAKKNDIEISVNRKPYKDYFTGLDHEYLLLQPLKLTNTLDNFRFEVRVKGSGISAQAGAVRHGISKAMLLYDKELKAQLKPAGLLKRDSRMVERKKAGFKKARKKEQWSKR
jgi:small subunit ribosomal protein S9